MTPWRYRPEVKTTIFSYQQIFMFCAVYFRNLLFVAKMIPWFSKTWSNPQGFFFFLSVMWLLVAPGRRWCLWRFASLIPSGCRLTPIHKVMGDHASRGSTSAGASSSTWSFPVFFSVTYASRHQIMALHLMGWRDAATLRVCKRLICKEL